jgi:hypothetical protein
MVYGSVNHDSANTLNLARNYDVNPQSSICGKI